MKTAASPNRTDAWFRLDNAARIYSSVVSSRLSTLFRLSATLTRAVNVGRLQTALDNLLPRFPYYAVQLRRGLFWYYFDSNPNKLLVTADSRFPCMGYRHRRGAYLMRVRAFRRRIAVEIAHALADGAGAVIFLKSLVAEYLRLEGFEFEAGDGLFTADQQVDTEEFEDAFGRYYRREIPAPRREGRAFHLPDKLAPAGTYHLITGTVRVGQAIAVAKRFGVSLTELLVAVYLDTFQCVLASYPQVRRRRLARPIRIDVPINLRPHFPSQTMRNFFLTTRPSIDPRLGEYTFEETLAKTHHHMRHEVDAKLLRQQIARNVRSQRNWVNRLAPLFVKDLVLAGVYRRMGQMAATSGLSNLGRLTMPASLSQHIERFDVVPVAPGLRKVMCAVISFGDKLSITFGRNIPAATVERIFFRRLVNLGLPVRIHSNET